MVSMSRIWALLIAGEMRIGSIHGNGCNGRDVEALKGGASTLPCFLIHPSIFFRISAKMHVLPTSPGYLKVTLNRINC